MILLGLFEGKMMMVRKLKPMMPMMPMTKRRRITKISGNCCNSQTIDGCLYQTCTFHHQIIILILIATIIPIIITILNTYPHLHQYHLHYQLTSASMKFFHCVQTLRETWFDELVWEAPFLSVPSVFGHWGWGVCKRMNKFPYGQGTFQKGASLSIPHICHESHENSRVNLFWSV